MNYLPTVDQFIKLGPICFSLLAVLLFICCKAYQKKKIEFIDIFVVGTAGSSAPSGLLLIYAAFDQSIVSKISDSNVYIAFAGIALLYVAALTVKDKFKATT
ncbi:TPA: hypothetical protein NG567_004544 [Vibrio parahaemolyticus]|nr:hypothetical protein [Vibrio parahaemolyticus]